MSQSWMAQQINQMLTLWQLSQSGDASMAGEAEHLAGVLRRLGITGGYVVDIAASNGVEQSCTLQFFRDERWRGLAVEMDRTKFSVLSFIYSQFPNARLARARVTPMNASLLLLGHEVPLNFDVLNLDIDSYDLQVIEAMLSAGYRPKVITMEVNEKIPPPVHFTVTYTDTHYWQCDHFYGCSLTAAGSVLRKYNYVLESLQFNNALFVQVDTALHGGISDVSDQLAYDLGYANRQGRQELFPWNADVDYLLRLAPHDVVHELANRFSKYKNYELRVADSNSSPTLPV